MAREDKRNKKQTADQRQSQTSQTQGRNEQKTNRVKEDIKRPRNK